MEKKLFTEMFDEKRREVLLNHPAYEPLREDLDTVYKKVCGTEFKPLTYSLFRLYEEKGSRVEYEMEYFARREALCVCFMKYFLYGTDEALRRLEDMIMLICDEYTWALPAHLRGAEEYEDVSVVIDLFAAETGHALSEIHYAVGDRLSTQVASRIRYEVGRRIINSFIQKHWYFEDTENNWLTVCGGCVGMAFLYLAPEKFDVVKERIRACMERFVQFYTDDGICLEGLGYWIYGFGYFIYFNELYRDFTGEYLNKPTVKIENMATFMNKMLIEGSEAVTFSDCMDYVRIFGDLPYRLRERFGEHIMLPNRFAKTYSDDENGRFAHAVRDWFWTHLEEKHDTVSRRIGTEYTSSAQWYIKREKKFFFAAKGGYNDEPHNHNDLGSFLISDYEKQLAVDLGAPEYDKDYFTLAKRYECLNSSSLGHSVPIIDGAPQCYGEEYRAEVLRAEEDCFELDLSGAYDAEAKVIRRFEFDEDGVTLTDSVSGARCWTQRIVSKLKPELTAEGVRIGKMLISTDTEPTVTETHTYKHNALRVPVAVYLVDFSRTTDVGVIRMVLDD